MPVYCNNQKQTRTVKARGFIVREGVCLGNVSFDNQVFFFLGKKLFLVKQSSHIGGFWVDQICWYIANVRKREVLVLLGPHSTSSQLSRGITLLSVSMSNVIW